MLTRPRHWFQVRLSTLLVLVALVSIAAGALGVYREAQRREQMRLRLERTLAMTK